MAQVAFNVVPPRNVIAGQRFQVVYRLSNAQAGNPTVGEIKGCQLLYGPSRSTTQSYQVINGVSTSNSTVDYTYVYRADNAGTYVIPAATIDVDGKKLHTGETSLRCSRPTAIHQDSHQRVPAIFLPRHLTERLQAMTFL